MIPTLIKQNAGDCMEIHHATFCFSYLIENKNQRHRKNPKRDARFSD